MRKEWTKEEVEDLKRCYGSTAGPELVARFQRSLGEIEAKAAALALGRNKAAFPGTRKMPRWDAEAVATLRRLYPRETNHAIALELGRSVRAVVCKANQLGLAKAPEHLAKLGREGMARRSSGRQG